MCYWHYATGTWNITCMDLCHWHWMPFVQCMVPSSVGTVLCKYTVYIQIFIQLQRQKKWTFPLVYSFTTTVSVYKLMWIHLKINDPRSYNLDLCSKQTKHFKCKRGKEGTDSPGLLFPRTLFVALIQAVLYPFAQPEWSLSVLIYICFLSLTIQ